MDADMARGAAFGAGKAYLVPAAEAVGVGGRRLLRGGGSAHQDMVMTVAAVVVMVVMAVVAVMVMVVMAVVAVMVMVSAAMRAAGVVVIAVVVMALEVGIEEE